MNKEQNTDSDLNSDIFKLIFEDTKDPIAITINGIHLLINNAYANLFGYTSEKELIDKSIKILIAPECVSNVKSYSENRFLGRDAPSFYETKGLKKDGTVFDIEIKASTFPRNGITNTLVIIRDITDAKIVEKELKRNNLSLTMITLCHQILLRADNESGFLNKICSMIKENGKYDLVWISLRDEQQQIFYNAADSEINNSTINHRSMVIPSKCYESKNIIIINDISSAALEESVKEELLVNNFQSLIAIPLMQDKEFIGSLNIYQKEEYAFNSEKYNFQNLAEDISYGINSIRIKEKQKNLETQLLQAQKMETIGTLAGGIAHDFNNIMTPILGYAELTLSHMPPNDPLYKYNQKILDGAIRAKELVKQILTFSHKENQKKRTCAYRKNRKGSHSVHGFINPQNNIHSQIHK